MSKAEVAKALGIKPENIFDLDENAPNREEASRAQKHVNVGDDLTMLRNPNAWYYRPLCAIKRRVEGSPFPECATILEDEEGMVYLVGMHEIAGLGQKAIKEKLGDAKTSYYDSWEELLKDGWVID